MQFSIVDVFAEAPLQGNQLAVFEAAGELDAKRMQSIAREMNFSETTFVTERTAHRAAVRIFTPCEELPFAGHPTLGTAHVLADGRDNFVLALGAGDVPVRFDHGLAWMTPPSATFGDALRPGVAAELIGQREEDLDPSHGSCLVDCGPKFVLIFVRSLDVLKRVRAESEFVAADDKSYALFVVCEQGYAPGRMAARMLFFDGAAMREDPATGSANSALAFYLQARGRYGRFVVDQGVEIARPSRLYLDVGQTVAVGGKVCPVATGQFSA
jgi:trans-2,3-dihydro-3-hydroxyanthranilate isomerase